MIEHGPCDPGNPPAARLWAGGRIPTIACGMIGAWPTRVKEWLTGRLSRSGQHSWGPQRARCCAGHLLRNRGRARLGVRSAQSAAPDIRYLTEIWPGQFLCVALGPYPVLVTGPPWGEIGSRARVRCSVLPPQPQAA